MQSEIEEPKNNKKAVIYIEYKMWKAPTKDKYYFLSKNHTWKEVEAPLGHKVSRKKWVFKIKRGSSREIICFKMRLVVRVFGQQECVDYQFYTLSWMRWHCRQNCDIAKDRLRFCVVVEEGQVSNGSENIQIQTKFESISVNLLRKKRSRCF